MNRRIRIGWRVYVDLNGDGDTEDSYEDYHTASDRSKPDTDGDGLNESQEKNLGTNPLYSCCERGRSMP